MSKDNKNIEDIFKDSFENFEADVKPDVWKNVQTGLKGAGIGVLIKTAINKLGSNAIIAITSSAATVLSTVLIMNVATDDNKTADIKTTETPKTTIEVPKPVKEDIKEFLSTDPKTNNDIKEKEPVKNDAPVVEKKNENSNTSPIKKDNMEAAINALSNQSIASASASTVGGAIPLIVSFSNNGNGKSNKWDFGDGKKETGPNPVHVYDVPGIYTVVLTSVAADGKTVTDNIKIEVTGNSSLMVPSEDMTFSPNGDGVNDIFVFQSKNIVEMNAVIFDEKTNVVKNIITKNGVDGKWDGTDEKGKPAIDGTYYYILNALGVDGKKYDKKGKINLTR